MSYQKVNSVIYEVVRIRCQKNQDDLINGIIYCLHKEKKYSFREISELLKKACNLIYTPNAIQKRFHKYNENKQEK